MDTVYLAVAAAFFAATWGLLVLCERLSDKPGERS
jgi:hypothetical protein